MPGWKKRELFAELKIPSDLPVIVRVDGWRFRRVAEELCLERPYDRRLMEVLVDVPRGLMDINFPVAFAFMFSDEISFVISPPLPWNGRLEKLVTILASYTAGKLSERFRATIAFDGRVVLVKDTEDIIDYMIWRQDEAWRNALNSYALKALEKEGLGRREAAEKLRGKRAEELHEIIFQKLGVNITKIPAWQRRGVVVRRVIKVKGTEFGPVERRAIESDWELPLFSSPEGREYLRRSLIAGMSVF